METQTENRKEGVILLHGLARTRKSMEKPARFLAENGFTVINQGYPSTKKTIAELADAAIPDALTRCRKKGAGRIHFVTHSMGGILVRHYLARHPVPELGRVVMISPPSRGSEVVDRLRHLAVFKWFNGPAGQQLGTGPDSVPLSLPEPGFETGIITGDRSVNLLLSMLIPGKNDGKVSVERAQLSGMAGFQVVHRSHPFIMNAPEVLAHTIFFIRNGRFDR